MFHDDKEIKQLAGLVSEIYKTMWIQWKYCHSMNKQCLCTWYNKNMSIAGFVMILHMQEVCSFLFYPNFIIFKRVKAIEVSAMSKCVYCLSWNQRMYIT